MRGNPRGPGDRRGYNGHPSPAGFPSAYRVRPSGSLPPIPGLGGDVADPFVAAARRFVPTRSRQMKVLAERKAPALLVSIYPEDWNHKRLDRRRSDKKQFA